MLSVCEDVCEDTMKKECIEVKGMLLNVCINGMV